MRPEIRRRVGPPPAIPVRVPTCSLPRVEPAKCLRLPTGELRLIRCNRYLRPSHLRPTANLLHKEAFDVRGYSRTSCVVRKSRPFCSWDLVPSPSQDSSPFQALALTLSASCAATALSC